MDVFDILGLVICIFFIYKFFTEDPFDRKTFYENYNRKITEHALNLGILDFMDIYQHESYQRESYQRESEEGYMDLPENFISTGTSKLVGFPRLSLSHSNDDKHVSVGLTFKFMNDTQVLPGETLLAKTVFTAMIEAIIAHDEAENIAAEKSSAIKAALNLIDNNGNFCLPPYDYMSDEAKYEYKKDNIIYSVSRKKDIMTFILQKKKRKQR